MTNSEGQQQKEVSKSGEWEALYPEAFAVVRFSNTRASLASRQQQEITRSFHHLTISREPDPTLQSTVPVFVDSFHRGQQLVERDGGEAGGIIAHGVWEYEFAAMQQCTAGVNNVGNVAFALRLVWR